jgi:hypothetical protein
VICNSSTPLISLRLIFLANLTDSYQLISMYARRNGGRVAVGAPGTAGLLVKVLPDGGVQLLECEFSARLLRAQPQLADYLSGEQSLPHFTAAVTTLLYNISHQ